MYLAMENHSVEQPTIARPQGGDQAVPATNLALEELGSIFAFIYHRVGNRPDAEDLTQEVAMRALPRLRDGRGSASVRSYLFATARSALADFWRLRLGRPVDELEEDSGAVSVPEDTPEAARAEVERVLMRLPAHYRRLLELRFLRGYSVGEAAKEMGVTLANAKILQYRALRRAAQIGEELPR
jgi:RNA polymerase sigma-70 factor (ECF subfamily)